MDGDWEIRNARRICLEADEEGNQQHCLRNARRLGFPSGDCHSSLEIQVNKMEKPLLAMSKNRAPAPEDSLGSFYVVTLEPGDFASLTNLQKVCAPLSNS